MAKRQHSYYVFVQLIPAIATAVIGTLAVGKAVPEWLGMVAVLSAIVTAIGTVLNPLQSYYEHLNAGKAFTVLKHDARSLQEVFGIGAGDDAVGAQVKSVHDRYNDLVRMAPPTEDWAFNRARKRIQAGVHNPDEQA